MALKYPIYINNIKFLVNPTSITINKNSQIGEAKTYTGYIYQPWVDNPDSLTLKGTAFGTNSYAELMNLRLMYEATDKKITLVYKGKNYLAFIKKMVVAGYAEKPRIFTYDIDISLVNPLKFYSEDIAIGAQITNSYSDTIKQALTEVEDAFNSAVSKFKI